MITYTHFAEADDPLGIHAYTFTDKDMQIQRFHVLPYGAEMIGEPDPVELLGYLQCEARQHVIYPSDIDAAVLKVRNEMMHRENKIRAAWYERKLEESKNELNSLHADYVQALLNEDYRRRQLKRFKASVFNKQ